MKPRLFFILLISLVFLSACGGEVRLSGEIVEWTADEAAGVASFIVKTGDGERFGVLATDETLVLTSGVVSMEAFQFEKPDGVLVAATCKSAGKAFTASDGTEIKAYTAKQIDITGRLTRNAFTMPDGTEVDLLRRSFANIYQLRDGTELLHEQSPTGPENVYVGGVESFEDLSGAAKANIFAYYVKQGLLYGVQEELERAYRDYSACTKKEDFSCRMVGQEISPTASNDRVIYFLTSVTLPSDGGLSTEVRLGAAFDRTTGDFIHTADLFSCGEQEAIRRLLAIAGVSDPVLQAEMLSAFKPEYVIFFPEGLEVCFPQGALPSQEHAYQIGLDYDESVSALLHDWALPQKMKHEP